MNTKTKIQIGSVVGIILIILLTVFTINSINENNKKERDETFKNNYDMCKSQAYQSYLTNWEGECKTSLKAEDCSLDLDIADRLTERLTNEEKECLDLYKIELK